MRHLCLPLLALAASCSFPQHIARKTLEESLPGAGIRELQCTSHNGGITIEGRPGTQEIRMRVEMSVRGYTPAEANANLELLEVDRQTVGSTLILKGKYDSSLNGMSPSFRFVLETPPELAVQLVSHNGNLKAVDTNGTLACETHNGDIYAKARANEIQLTTHNGNVAVELDGTGTLNGAITSHNGDIELRASSMSTAVDARTHNGSIRLRDGADGAERISIRKRHAEFRLQGGNGSLEIETHNGNVVIR